MDVWNKNSSKQAPKKEFFFFSVTLSVILMVFPNNANSHLGQDLLQGDIIHNSPIIVILALYGSMWIQETLLFCIHLDFPFLYNPDQKD